jgi:hypothetical protein
MEKKIWGGSENDDKNDEKNIQNRNGYITRDGTHIDRYGLDTCYKVKRTESYLHQQLLIKEAKNVEKMSKKCRKNV